MGIINNRQRQMRNLFYAAPQISIKCNYLIEKHKLCENSKTTALFFSIHTKIRGVHEIST